MVIYEWLPDHETYSIILTQRVQKYFIFSNFQIKECIG